MKTDTSQATYILDQEAVDRITGTMDEFFSQLRIERQNRIRMRLVMEDILLRILDHSPEPRNCSVEMGRHFAGVPFVEFIFDGERYDPTAEQEGETGWSRDLLVSMGFAPSWSWRGGKNCVRLRIRVEKSISAIALPISAFLGAALGGAGKGLPDAVRALLMDIVLEPLFEVFIGLMVTFVGLMLFLSVCCAVFSAGDTVAFGRYGKRLIKRFVGMSFLTATIVTLVAQPFFRLAGTGFMDAQAFFSALVRLVLSILPQDLVSPFLKNDSLQLIFLGVVMGVGLLTLGSRAQTLKTVAEQAYALISLVMESFSRLTPAFVCITLIRCFWLGSIGVLLGFWKPLGIFIAFTGLLLLSKLMFVSLRLKVPVRVLMQKLRPSMRISLATASNAAAFGETMNNTVRRFGVAERLANFALPVGSTIYMPGSVCAFLLTAFYLAEAYQVKVNFAWFIMAAVVCTMMAISMPPVPGAGIGCYSIMLAQLGIPAEGLVVAAALHVFMIF